jgi:Sec-independent protein secretion pathway component TatC
MNEFDIGALVAIVCAIPFIVYLVWRSLKEWK